MQNSSMNGNLVHYIRYPQFYVHTKYFATSFIVGLVRFVSLLRRYDVRYLSNIMDK